MRMRREKRAKLYRRIAEIQHRGDMTLHTALGDEALLKAIELEDEAYYGEKIARILRRGVIGECLENQMIK